MITMMSTHNPSTPSVDHKFVFVMEFFHDNLRNVIFNDDSVTPAKAENTKRAIESFLKWAIGIADGLHYIHQKRLFHRHLKLENILVCIYHILINSKCISMKIGLGQSCFY
jgi:serine/threonine protein kinase